MELLSGQNKIKDETYNRLFELSSKTKDKLVTPLILDYYNFESLGVDTLHIGTGIGKLEGKP